MVVGLSGLASAPLFSDAANATGELVGSDGTMGGYILGALVVILLVVGTVALLPRADPMVVLVVVGVGVILAVLVGWWGVWTVLFLAFILIFALVKPFGERTGA